MPLTRSRSKQQQTKKAKCKKWMFESAWQCGRCRAAGRGVVMGGVFFVHDADAIGSDYCCNVCNMSGVMRAFCRRCKIKAAWAEPAAAEAEEAEEAEELEVMM